MPSLQLQKDPLSPRSFALKSMNQLRDWMPSDLDVPHIASVALKPRNMKPNVKPRILLTHDMAGGYKEDADVQGNMFKDIYFIQRLHFVDIFNYFSHERVSIPPVNWINTCHRNGIKCLGTFLVEGNNQMHEMEALLHGPPFIDGPDEDPMRLWHPFYADKLVAIAKRYNFDGWLINIECEFFPFPTNPRFKSQELAKFIGYLTDKIHQEIPGSQIIWYDSMIDTGEIDYQNQLTHLNALFFKNADGIFINYWWKKEYPEMTRRTAERYGKSGYDVYFGTDVWGRGTFGGGGFNTYRSVKTATLAQTSSALFGMAWTYEHFDKLDFERMDRLFWEGGDYSEYPPTSPGDPTLSPESEDSEEEGLSHTYHKGIANVISLVSHVPSNGWFVTTFDRGFGNSFYHRGKRLLLQPWSHLSHQAILPNLKYSIPDTDPIDENIQLNCSLEHDYEAFLGGTSLLLKGQRLNHRESRDMDMEISVPLYSLDLDVSQGFTISYAFRTLFDDDVKVVMYCHMTLETTNSAASDEFVNCWLPHANIADREEGVRTIVTIRSEGQLNSLCYIFPVQQEGENENDWIIKRVQIPSVNDEIKIRITQVDMHVMVNTASLVGIKPHLIVCLGYLSILPFIVNEEDEMQNQISHFEWSDTKTDALTESEDEQTVRFFGTLHWKQQTFVSDSNYSWKETDYYLISYEAPDGTRTYLGTSFCPQYRISGLDCSDPEAQHRIVVEPVDAEGYANTEAYATILF